MWIARDENKCLTLFLRKPYRDNDCKCWWIKPIINDTHLSDYDAVIGEFMFIDPSLFPELTWDDEPIEISIYNKNDLAVFISGIITEYNDNCHPKTEYIKERIDKHFNHTKQ